MLVRTCMRSWIAGILFLHFPPCPTREIGCALDISLAISCGVTVSSQRPTIIKPINSSRSDPSVSSSHCVGESCASHQSSRAPSDSSKCRLHHGAGGRIAQRWAALAVGDDAFWQLFLTPVSDTFWRRSNHQSGIQEGLQKWNHQAQEVGAKAQQAGELDGWQHSRG